MRKTIFGITRRSLRTVLLMGAGPCALALPALAATAQHQVPGHGPHPATARQPARSTDAGPARKEAATTPAKPAGHDAQGLEEVTVSATRRTTSVQHTPMAIDAISGRVLTQMHAQGISDYATQIPGLSIQDQGPGQKRLAIRNLTAAGEPQVGMYLDEIPIVGFTGENTDAGSAQPDVKLWDMQRIEVLKGPQGTLYGSGSEGGTVRIISERPDLAKFGGRVDTSVSTYATGGFNNSQNGTINIPIIKDKLAIRLSAYRDSNAGWIKEYYLQQNGTNWVHNAGGRLNIRYRPMENWTIDFIGYRQNTNTGDLFNLNPQFDSVAHSKWAAANFVKQPMTDQFQAYNLISTNHMHWTTLTAIASWQERKMEYTHDTSFNYGNDCSGGDFWNCYPLAQYQQRLASGQINAVNDRQRVSAWTAEVRLSAPSHARIQWTGGVFYQMRKNMFNLYYGGVDSAGFFDRMSDGYAPTTKYARANWDDTQQIAEFGELTYPITSKLKVTGGVRVFQVSRTLNTLSIMPFMDFSAVPTYYPKLSAKENSATGKFLVSYDITPNAMVYAEAAEGYRIGGPNLPIGFTVQQAPPYQPDTVWDYEFGWKTGWWNNRVTFNGAFYRMNWSNVQQQGTDPTGAFDYIVNAGSAAATGFEAELAARPIRALQLGLGTNYADAQLVGRQPYQPLAVNQTHAGDPLPYVPRWTLNANATYTFDVLGHETYLRGDIAYQSGRSTAFNRANPDYIYLGGWFLANVNLGMKFGRYSAQIFASNILNRQTRVSGHVNSVMPVYYNSSPPATVGLDLSATF
ncbi:TonB-dependent receptor [Gluconacetobacter tumulicola]|uniref:TonB-dependent receptor n=1 Tax=Gluconacetobacter tumulicola TaxID=1017177 RepID=A0A7W4P5C9_9PROT|nr:TonB-dependent receptor [Gluconacetobacter tumulicola]MBB2177927.1 TonB-dependent receptor [Gluconacetobacter tumulicola]